MVKIGTGKRDKKRIKKGGPSSLKTLDAWNRSRPAQQIIAKAGKAWPSSAMFVPVYSVSHCLAKTRTCGSLFVQQHLHNFKIDGNNLERIKKNIIKKGSGIVKEESCYSLCRAEARKQVLPFLLWAWLQIGRLSAALTLQ